MEEGFWYVKNWDAFWDRWSLYRKNGLCLICNKVRLLALKIKVFLENDLN